MTRTRRLVLALVSLWLGTMLFLALAVAPAVFASVGRLDAGRIMALIFPWYYGASLVLPAAALLVVLPESRRSRSAVATVTALSFSLAAAFWSVFVIQPRIAKIRVAMDAPGGISDVAITSAFSRLHSQSIGVLLTLMGLAVVVIVIEVAARPASRVASS
ncbi:MAG: hypothetical protein A2Y95_11340 [Deltaproteobacteria bacterium RBG_13_65_10]|nr:MAG: hypothetical protein A2Y95_11340 [Deltaproteobacteria bacterium RBG_13_65_10]